MATTKKVQSKEKITSKKWFKIGLPVVLVLLFALAGAYYVNRSSAATGDGAPNYISSIQGHSCITSGKYPPTLRQGSTGECVKALQLGLNNRKAFIAWTSGGKIANNPLVVDARFGVSTTVAVKEYQTAKKISADGVAGKQFWDQFLSDCTIKASCYTIVSGTGKY